LTWPLGLFVSVCAYRAYTRCPGCSFTIAVRHIVPSAVGLTHASSVIALVRSSDGASATVTMLLVPLNWSAPP
jgi:hypothetical protein